VKLSAATSLITQPLCLLVFQAALPLRERITVQRGNGDRLFHDFGLIAVSSVIAKAGHHLGAI